ncbi:hypothetical protein H5410_046333 [Solanum commersonii]|uniref:Uncharacterized protein n=1 Tax=Solanum commersonii TaxID=4109 RepID=A0A9J5XBZ2_SOLCO|nr:hypothetical protein H5410_046333 [Solanum commersonii]
MEGLNQMIWTAKDNGSVRGFGTQLNTDDSLVISEAEVDQISHLRAILDVNNNNNNIPSKIPLGGVWGGYNVRRPYHYLVEVERLFPRDPQLKQPRMSGGDISNKISGDGFGEKK